MYELRKETGTTFVYAYDGTHGEIKAFDFLYSHVMYHEGFKYYVGHTDGYPKRIALVEANSHAFAVTYQETVPNIAAKKLCDFYMFKLKKKGFDVPSAVDSFNSRNNLFIDIWKIIM